MFSEHSQQIIGSGRGKNWAVGSGSGSGRGQNKKNPGQGWKVAGAPLYVDQRPGRPAQSDEGGSFNLDRDPP
jgi:hypothetical protein